MGFGGLNQILRSAASWVLWAETKSCWQSRWNIAPIMQKEFDVINLSPNNDWSLWRMILYSVLWVAGLLDTHWWQQLIILHDRESMLFGLTWPSSLPPLILCARAHCMDTVWPTTDVGCHLLAKSPLLFSSSSMTDTVLWTLIYDANIVICVLIPQHHTDASFMSLI